MNETIFAFFISKLRVILVKNYQLGELKTNRDRHTYTDFLALCLLEW
jgi:hypothetical protein